jgi:hypothetical protein
MKEQTMSGQDNSDYHTEINLDGTTPETFMAFIDDVAAELPDAVCLIQDKPIMGEPYVVVKVKQDYGHYPLIVEGGQSLYIGNDRAWVATSSDIL